MKFWTSRAKIHGQLNQKEILNFLEINRVFFFHYSVFSDAHGAKKDHP